MNPEYFKLLLIKDIDQKIDGKNLIFLGDLIKVYLPTRFKGELDERESFSIQIDLTFEREIVKLLLNYKIGDEIFSKILILNKTNTLTNYTGDSIITRKFISKGNGIISDINFAVSFWVQTDDHKKYLINCTVTKLSDDEKIDGSELF
ncbi:hypothetical protein ND860_18665 [Leptospira levettii]|uniref:hypothetical protein n=1 Tax=Leptospira levettii TaxID=2023178 RepID=UPI00223D9334|nr:hypothetical protein [Leptospira levettii]MCW7498565.1 hypothetical protein [Leptospira levettii]